jgi:hypothetical protein
MESNESESRALTASPASRWPRNRRRGWTLLLALALAAASPVRAADLCVDLSGGGGFVLKRFRAPGRNRCAPTQGFERLKFSAAFLTGSACVQEEGRYLILHYTVAKAGIPTGYLESATCRVELPIPSAGRNGTCAGMYVIPGNSDRFYQAATFRPCDEGVPF